MLRNSTMREPLLPLCQKRATLKLTAIGFLTLLWAWRVACGTDSNLPEGQIPLHSPAGIRLLEESDARANFYSLMQRLESQQTLSYCGVASAVTVLNTLHLTNAPLCETLNRKFPYFDQSNFFSREVEQVVPRSVAAKIGLTLEEWAAAVGSYGVKTEAHHCGEGEGEVRLAAFLARAKTVLKSPNQNLVVNFQRGTLGQIGSGHFSPVGAYNEKADKFLILEVALFKYPVFWVDAGLLWKAMNTRDSVSLKNRGFVVVTAKPN
jgi:hypothetical protein